MHKNYTPAQKKIAKLLGIKPKPKSKKNLYEMFKEIYEDKIADMVYLSPLLDFWDTKTDTDKRTKRNRKITKKKIK